MTTTAQKPSNEQEAVSTDEAAISEVLLAWSRVFQGFKAHLRTNATVVTSDLRLSIKAVVVVLFSIIALVSLGIVIWVTLLTGMAYGLTSYGFHWLWSLLLILVLNTIALVVIKGIFVSAFNSIKMKATAALLFNSEQNKA